MRNTHETFVRTVADLAIARIPIEAQEPLKAIKLVYGAGASGLRGVTYFERWKGNGDGEPAPFVEVCAFGQESWIQVAGTTIHELGHVLAGLGHGHDKGWREACGLLGLRKARAIGHQYFLSSFEPDLRMGIVALPKPDEGAPVRQFGTEMRLKPCPMGRGTRGGKSFGKGSGSRLRLFECNCEPPVKVRLARDVFEAHCDLCASGFHRPTEG